MKLIFYILIFTALSSSFARSGKSPEAHRSLQLIPLDSIQTPNMRFVMRVLPGNFWVLNLYTDSRYEYLVWSDWVGTRILERGKYSIKKTTLTLFSDSSKTALKIHKYSLKEGQARSRKIKYDCCEVDKKEFCLYAY